MNQESLPDITCRVGIVVIGRNEAPRLEDCLRSLACWRDRLAYVDSGSTDGTPAIAERFGVRIVRLTDGPHCAARGRQAGLEYLLSEHPDLQYVQFVDGDCVVQPGWLEAAASFLDQQPQCAAVCGILQERYADRSLLIRLMDVEWRLPFGWIEAIGGVFMARTAALQEVHGWASDLVVGEDLDLGMRLHARGWLLQRLPREMALHDLGIRSLREFWRRSVRTGIAYTHLAMLHGRAGYRQWRRRAASSVFYGAALPSALLAACALHSPLALLLLTVYIVLIARVVRRQVLRGEPANLALCYGCLLLLSKSAEAVGVARFILSRLVHLRIALLEYKLPATRKDS